MLITYCIFAYGMCVIDALWVVLHLSKSYLDYIMLMLGVFKFFVVTANFIIVDNFTVAPYALILEIIFTSILAIMTVILIKRKFAPRKNGRN